MLRLDSDRKKTAPAPYVHHRSYARHTRTHGRVHANALRRVINEGGIYAY